MFCALQILEPWSLIHRVWPVRTKPGAKMSKTIVVVRNLYPLNIGMNDCTTFGLSPVHTGSKVCIQAHQKLMDLCSGCKFQLVPKFEKCWVFSLYLRRSSCFIRLCFSLCSPSVTRYISLKQDRRNLLLNSYSIAHCRETQLIQTMLIRTFLSPFVAGRPVPAA